MKKQLLSIAVALSLSACASTSAPNINTDTANVPVASVATTVETQPTPAYLANGDKVITLEKIMSDPDWMGRSAESWYWGDDSNTVFYQQKREGNPIRDLYQQSLSQQAGAQTVKLANMHIASDRFAQVNKAGTHEVYIFSGNVFVKALASQQVQQLTYTSVTERDAMFLTNGDVAYRVGDKFFQHSLRDNRIVELASLVMSEAPSSDESLSYIAQEQHELIDYIALQKRNDNLRAEQADKLKAQNSSITTTEFYLGKGNRVVHASLSPKGDKMVVSITKAGPTRDESDIMPNYIASDGHIKAEKVRHRVADNRKYQEQLFLLDLKSGQKFPLSYDQLPGFDEDVLASVRQENYQREGKTYESKKSPRNIHVMRTWDPIKWQADGNQVAVMLEAWDNKDRWIATVDLLQNKLTNQHRLHDEAWINYTFNEFGWLNKSNTLYFLSEQSGYSHLYTKSLKGKVKQITSGQYEVSDLTLSQDESEIYFKANVKHPGIYEIYKVATAGGEIQALTDMGGMNDYALSPDESKLLIEHSTVTMPPELYVIDMANNAQPQQITYTVSDEFKSMPFVAPSVVAVPSSHQDEPIYSRVYLPKNFNQAQEKHRAVMFSHGAGYLQNSHLGWSGYFREYMFHSMLAQQGYVVIDMDYRASRGYGRDWRTAIYRHMGKPEVQDMLDGVEWLVENANVDRNRIGTYGGSYGGFLTLMALFNEPETFQSGSALRLVSDWAYYNHGYTSNILNTPEDDKIAYERSSPIYFAEGLNKPLLINAPMVDDNVFFQDSVRLVQRLIELEKENFETAIYPVEPHGFVQPSSWLDEYRRIYKLFENTL
ncbi:prolyl oligopeptidase family serine peptidase [Thalassotalea sp. LPB0316]|uniref:S9 family peptidase n=1 Tax=Thalassotalea sp. LPB0316 TaxID=2769490 RepID=UPI001865B773|nr:prolyl oligopeptidase family serine peptidase [Thalassotalea sp. LPB0316]QOL24722.1 prolyl oligopeptidase family serine peptidase [Thalassotalea sp. LPB0316]